MENNQPIVAPPGVVHVSPIQVWGSDATGPATDSQANNSPVPAQVDMPAQKSGLETTTQNILGANAFSAGYGTENFFPTSFLGWFVLCVILSLFVFLARRAYRKTYPNHPHHAHTPQHIVEN